MRLEEIFPTPIWIFDNMNLDVDSIKFWAYEEKKKDEGRIISNVGGWQSNDYRTFDNTPLQVLVKYALKESHHIAADLGIPKSERVLENLWVNINPKYSYNQAHVHPESRLSGVFYVDAPEKSGDICFSRDNGYALGTVAPELTRYSGVEMKYPAKTNRMLIFPACVEHHVKPNLSDEDRISISFNIL